jgi:hypothetical protein
MHRLPKLAALAFVLAPLGLAQEAHAQAAGAPEFTFEGDMVRGHACVLSSLYKRGEGVAWRVRVIDPETGQSVDDKGLKSLVVILSDGQKFPMRYGAHPKGGTPTDNFWATSWEIPATYPTGSFSYRVVATDLDGHETDWQPFKVAASQLTILAN